MLHFAEQLFPAVFGAKHFYYLLDVGDKVGNCLDGSTFFLGKMRMRQARNLDFKSENLRLMRSICSWNGTSSQSALKGEEKILKVESRVA